MTEIIEDNKLVELKYEIFDKKSGEVLIKIEYPISYVHGSDSVLSSDVTSVLEGQPVGC